MKIAVTGAGNVGGTLARRWGKIGHSIYLGVKDPKTGEAIQLAKKIGIHASVHSSREAVKQAEIVVLSTPWQVTEGLVKDLATELVGKPLIDCTNPLKKDLSSLELGFTTSAAEQIQAWVPKAPVFKAFNTTGFNIMEDPILDGRKTVMFYCGDDQEHREKVRELVTDMGFEGLDVGPLSSARLLEPFALLWIQSAYQHGLGRDFSFGILRRK